MPFESVFMFADANWLRRQWTKLLCFMLNKPWPRTLFCSTCKHKCFYWLVVHKLLHFSISCVLCRAKANKQAKKKPKIYNKETCKFHSQSPFINLLAWGFAHLFQSGVARAFLHNLGKVWVFFTLFFKKNFIFFVFQVIENLHWRKSW